MDTGLRGKRALVTGGRTGIGFGIAEALVAEGVAVVLASRTSGEASAESLSARGGNAVWLRADVSSESGVVAMVAEAWDVWDGLDLYVNNAAGTWHEAITKLTGEGWAATLATNLSACAFSCREFARRLIGKGEGAILIVGSTAAHVPLYRESSYRVSKMGLKALMEVVAIELLPHGIRVNMLTPGPFVTELTRDLPASQMGGAFIPSRRAGEVHELGGAAVLLLSDKLSSYTVGSELVVDGGFRLRPMELFSLEEIRRLNE